MTEREGLLSEVTLRAMRAEAKRKHDSRLAHYRELEARGEIADLSALAEPPERPPFPRPKAGPGQQQ